MTPRERVTRFLKGEAVDRIPNGLGGCETAGLHNLAYDTLKRILGVSDPKNRVCTFMNNAIFEPPILESMEGDIILLASRLCPSRLWGLNADSEWKPLDIWGTQLQVAKAWDFRQDPDGTWWWDNWTKCPPGAIYFDPPPVPPGDDPFGDMGTPPSPDDFNPSHEFPEEWLTRLQEDAKFLYETTNFAISCGEMIHDLQLKPGGLIGWWMRMVEEPEACHEFLGKAVDAALAHLRQLDQAIGKYCVILGMADDMGDQRGITIGPDLWRTIYKPHYKRLFTEWHRITGMKVNLHTCGSMVDILDDLIECGVDIYNPVQISADHMDPATLKEKHGHGLIFYGGSLDATLFPPTMPVGEVYEGVKHNIETLSAGGGYLFAGVHNIPGDLPEGHIRAMIQAWRDCRDNPALSKIA